MLKTEKCINLIKVDIQEKQRQQVIRIIEQNLKQHADSVDEKDQEEKIRRIAQTYFDIMCKRYNQGGLDLNQIAAIDESEERNCAELDNECTFCMEVLPVSSMSKNALK